MMARILIVDDEKILTEVLKDFLQRQDYEVTVADRASSALEHVSNTAYDVVLLDLKLPDQDGLSLIPQIKDLSPETGIIIITAYAEVKSAVAAIKNGAFDYLAKPFEEEELLLTIEKFLHFRSLTREIDSLKRSLHQKRTLTKFVGESKVVQDLLANLEVIAETDLSVLLLGESGTGKELIAQLIHDLSPRSSAPFIKLNCTAIPETLFEAEFFGYVKGAFSGATQARIGKIELAQRGTLLLDEIGDLSPSLQPKLLRVLEEKTFYPLGSTKEKRVDVRFLFATSKDLRKLLQQGLFREDLYYRISGFVLKVPPLRERREDLPLLIQHFLHLLAQNYQRPLPEIEEKAYLALLNYSYPGNVRELKHLLERAFLLARGGIIKVKHLPEEVVKGLPEHLGESESRPEGPQIKRNLEFIERELILRTLEECEGRIGQAARKLGISRKTLWKKLKKYSIILPS